MRKASHLFFGFLLALLFFMTSMEALSADRSLCKGDCANSPVPMDQVLNMSKYSSFVTQEQIQKISKELLVEAPRREGKEMTTVPVVVLNEPFNPDKYAKKSNKALRYDEGPVSNVFLSFQMQNSLSTATEPEDRVTVKHSASNSMLHETKLIGKDGGTRTQKLDAVSETFQASVEKKISPNMSITMTIEEHNLLGKPSVLYLQPASDKIIEKAHTKMGYEDTYDRKRLGMDQATGNIKDQNGNSFPVGAGQTYVMPLQIHWKQFDRIEALSSADGKSESTLVTGIKAQAPLGNEFRQSGIGATATYVYNGELRENLVLTIAAGIGAHLQHTLGSGYQPHDKKTTVNWSGDLAAGITCIGKNNTATSLMLTFSADSTPLKGSNYRDPRGNFLQRQSHGATTDGHDYAVGLAVKHKFRDGSTLGAEVKEDVGGKYKRPKSIGGNNNRDFYVGIEYSKPF